VKYVIWAYGRKEGCCVWFQKLNRAKRIVTKTQEGYELPEEKEFCLVSKV